MNASSHSRIYEYFTGALSRASGHDTPYPYWTLTDLFPDDIIGGLQLSSFPIASAIETSGRRAAPNNTRHYFDSNNIAASPVIAAVAHAFQTPSMIASIERFFKIDLEGNFLRIEYAQDVNGFWLEPHTDLSVKKLTILIYLSSGKDHETLGTDIYTAEDDWVARTPFAPNIAMAFVPGSNTYHGFEKRPINGVRKSLILNYVTAGWRDREQLAFPDQPVSSH